MISAVKKIDKIIERANNSPGSPLKKMVELVQKERDYGQMQPLRQPAPQSEPNKKSKPKLMVDELPQLNKRERKLISAVYEIIRNNLPDKFADELIKNIQDELQSGAKKK